MHRASSRIAAVAAAALVAIACNYVRADPATAQADPATGAGEPAQADAPPISSAEDSASNEGSPGGAATLPESESGGAGAPEGGTTPAAAPTQEWTQPGPSQPGPSQTDPAPTAGSSTPAAPAAPAPPSSGAAGPATQRIVGTPPAPTEPPAGQASAPAPSTPGQGPSAEGEPAAVAAPPAIPAPAIKPAPVADAGSTPTDRRPGGTLQSLLSDVGREVRKAHGQIDGIRRRLDHGEPPPARRLTRLRTTLVQVTPMLVALEVRLDAAGRLSPRLGHFLNRVRDDLRGVRVAAQGLATALRRSGADGAELRLLVKELEHFRAVSSALASNTGVVEAPAPPVAGAGPAYSQAQPAPAQPARVQPAPVQPAPVAAPPPAGGRPADQTTGAAQETGPSDGRAHREPAPWLTAPSSGSATASPGGAFFFAGLASLTMVLIGLALPALRTRLELRPSRRYSVALLAPLERPG
jgi:hypothetical protein